MVNMYQSKKAKWNWQIKLIFQITLHIKDEKILIRIKEYFGGIGHIEHLKNKPYVSFKVYKNEDLYKIIYNHFENYPLQTTKMIYFILWGKVLKRIIRKEHLSLDGFKRVLIIKSAFKNGLSLSLKQAYPDIKPEATPELVSHIELDPYWVSGFTAGASLTP